MSEQQRIAFVAHGFEAMAVARSLRRTARRLRVMADKEGYVPPPGRVNTKIARAATFERIAGEIEAAVGPMAGGEA